MSRSLSGRIKPQASPDPVHPTEGLARGCALPVGLPRSSAHRTGTLTCRSLFALSPGSSSCVPGSLFLKPRALGFCPQLLIWDLIPGQGLYSISLPGVNNLTRRRVSILASGPRTEGICCLPPQMFCFSVRGLKTRVCVLPMPSIKYRCSGHVNRLTSLNLGS